MLLDKGNKFTTNTQEFIAHVRASDGAEQPLYDHLTGTAEISKRLATKIGLPLSGDLIGLVHDLGKYSQAFQNYIRECVQYDNYKDLGLDEDEEAEMLVKGKPKRGSVDHSTAGAIYLYQQFKDRPKKKNLAQGALLADILFLCVASHHSGLINVVDKEGQPYLYNRKIKPEEKTHLQEALSNAISNKLFDHLDSKILNATVREFHNALIPILADKNIKSKQQDFYIGFYARLLFSCLIDADRSNSIAFEHPSQAHLLEYECPNWQTAIDKVEDLYQDFADKAKHSPPNPINEQRSRIAQTCLDAGQKSQGIYTLTVPTGGGKTLASLRFAVQHAKCHNLDRIIYIIPFTSIIEQNAAEVRKILEQKLPDGSYVGDWVLEQHSNLEPDVQTWQSKLIMDNWNAPIVFTTMVQFLESCFGGGTKGVRRLHQLSRAVLIFDEIQTLPINCYYLFCNAINFLTSYTNTTAVLCTATQPVLNKLPIAQNGSLNPATEIIGDHKDLAILFDTLKRVDIHDHTENLQDLDSVTEYINENFTNFASTLVIVNTKAWASDLYKELSKTINSNELFHLSTGQCARHRKDLLNTIRKRLKEGLPTLVISTQLIEAGVDVSFKSVIRFLAGLDSIAQASGRCNRHGEMVDEEGKGIKGKVFIVKPDKENLSRLPTIALSKAQMENTILPMLREPQNADKHLLDPDIMNIFFKSFYQTDHAEKQMAYPVDNIHTVFNWLSSNKGNIAVNNDNEQLLKEGQFPKLWQSFMEAGKAFKAIDAPTKAVIVPYGEEGRNIITALYGTQASDKEFYKLVREAQQYSVNIFPFMLDKLTDAEAINQVRDTGILTLSETFYDKQMGLNLEGNSKLDFIGGF
ncbi:CRISPR-associated helicase Cas3' [Psychrobacter sanguinis]|uniref:CRISPR-associated helicase Cas3' n=1 Tax=Psychrobacter sanguinis TaxID=861445 RepID=UPI001919F845|nr:CRISPR-associated helicase Cas3' [Psychrobacter sanguinis]MCC3308283.1 CRISPR-associated helicase Cas3' [Psychrobacter sanguinis]